MRDDREARFVAYMRDADASTYPEAPNHQTGWLANVREHGEEFGLDPELVEELIEKFRHPGETPQEFFWEPEPEPRCKPSKPRPAPAEPAPRAAKPTIPAPRRSLLKPRAPQNDGRDRGADDLERRFQRGEVARRRDLLEGVIPTPSYGGLIAPPKHLKTYFELNLIRAVCKSEPSLLGLAVNGGSALLLALELSEAQLAERLNKIVGPAWPSNLRYYVRETMPRVESPLEWLRGEILRLKPALVAIDTKEKFFGEMPHSANLFGSDYREGEAVRALAYETNCAILFTDHAKKATTGRNPFSDSVRTHGHGASVDYQHELVYRLGATRAKLVCAGNDVAFQRIDLAIDLATMRFTLGDAAKGGGRPDEERQGAKAWLAEAFADLKARPASDISKLAHAAGIAEKTLNKAKCDLGIASKKGPKGWTWIPPKGGFKS